MNGTMSFLIAYENSCHVYISGYLMRGLSASCELNTFSLTKLFSVPCDLNELLEASENFWLAVIDTQHIFFNSADDCSLKASMTSQNKVQFCRWL
jgi:hypothetical protein